MSYAVRISDEMHREEAIISLFRRCAIADVLGIAAVRMLLSANPSASYEQSARLQRYYEPPTSIDLALIESTFKVPIQILTNSSQKRMF
jgi:hypothetical protein